MVDARRDARVPEHPAVEDVTMQQVLEALADPIRRAIVRGLYRTGEDRACGTFPMVVSKSTGTHHFKVLREAGLIRQYYRGTSRMNSLRRSEIDAAFPGLLEAIAGHPEPALEPPKD